MTNIFKRIQHSVSADVHQMLDQKERKNPIGMLNEYLRQCEREIEKMRKTIERQHLLKEEFTREWVQASELAEKRKKQAEIAEKAGEQDLHQFAVQDQAHYEERAKRLKESKELAIKQLDELEKKYEEMKHKLKDMQLKRLELMGRENIAKAHYQANQMLTANGGNKTYARFSEMENYLERIEQQVNTDYYRNTIDSRISQLEKELNQEIKAQ